MVSLHSRNPAFGKLTLVSVGPGDPSLLTIAGVKAIQESTLVAFPIAKAGGESIALEIASTWIKKEAKKLPLLFPMVSEEHLLREAWRNAADQLFEEIKKGEKVVFLCEGDGSLFASSSYVLLALKTFHPNCPIKSIPGVTSFAAAAALANWPLALQKDQLLILPTPDDQYKLETLINEAFLSKRVLVLLKLGSRWAWVKPLLKKKGLLEDAVFAQRVGFEDEKVDSAIKIDGSEKPYFSLLLIRQSWPEVIPFKDSIS